MQIRFRQAKSILNRSKLGGYTLNPYLGCPHGCVYCYNQHFLKTIGRQEKWGEFLEIKLNAPEVLEREILGKYRNLKDDVFFSTITDPYNPLERQYQLTRHCLEVLLKNEWSAEILTKSDLILRDLDLMKRFRHRLKIGFTIITLDQRAGMILEPGAPSLERRMDALKKIKKVGLKTYVFVGPILPHFTNLKQLFEILKDKVDQIWFDTLNTKKENWQGLEKTLKIHYPSLLNDYKKIFFANRKDYENQLREEIKFLAKYFETPIKICF
ncbi:MAG: radical SAM protein [Patescibacteria group bacterium]|nr:radical SAM protein [Patescibacteria group bacterium]